MEFKHLIRSRFADPLTAIDLSNRYVCHGSAMGRIAFCDMERDFQELVLFDSQPELIRGISHSTTGEDLYISIGDVSCQKLDARTLQVKDNVLIVEDVDERQHKANCERSYTLLHKQYNCVLTINLPRDTTDPVQELAPINISDLEANLLVQHTPEDLIFTQNSVPFDFDGEHLIFMQYMENSLREVLMYKVSDKQTMRLLRFTKADSIVSHVKLAKNPTGGLILIYVQGGRQIKSYDVARKTHQLIGIAPDSILALHVRANKLRQVDGGEAEPQPPMEDPESQVGPGTPELMVSVVDDSENVQVYFYDQDKKLTTFKSINIKKASHANKSANQMHKQILSKHFFGMGYPYFICGYNKHVAVTSDYGILLFSVDKEKPSRFA